MKKTALVFITLLTSISILAIDITNSIPSSSIFVLTINGENLLNKMPLEELEELPIYDNLVKKSILKKFNNGSTQVGLEDIGINLNSTSYLFYELSDSSAYTSYLTLLSSPNNLKNIIQNSFDKIETIEGINFAKRGKNTVAWNNEFVLFIQSTFDWNYFYQDADIYNRYDIDYNPEESDFSIDNQKIQDIWTLEKIKNIFHQNSPSIKSNTNFLANQDKKADAIFWSNTLDKSLSLAKKMHLPFSQQQNSQTSSPYKDMSLCYKVFFNETNIKIKGGASISKELLSSYKKIAKLKMNKNFYKYVSDDNLIGYYGISLSTQSTLEEYPEIIKPYLSYIPEVSDISSRITDLISLVIDEKAIGNLIKGDAMFVVTDLKEKEVTYTDYEYDYIENKVYEQPLSEDSILTSNYYEEEKNYSEPKEVIKTRKEVVPNMLLMLSTNNEKNAKNILELLIKSGIAKKIDNYYLINLPDNFSLDIYCLVKDGIVFFCNSKDQLTDIIENKVKKLSAKHTKSLSKNTGTAYIDGGKIFSKIPRKENNNKGNLSLEYAKNNLLDVMLIQQKPSSKGTRSEVIFNTSDKNKNSLEYVFHFINDLYKIEQETK